MSTTESNLPPVALAEVTRHPNDYEIHQFTEASDPASAQVAWTIHAEGYVNEGFLHPSAVTSEGYLPKDIDKARGSLVKYYIAMPPDDLQDAATMRKVSAPEGNYTELPAYGVSDGYLSVAGLDRLDGLHQNGADIRELGALARRPNSNPLSAHVLFRTVIQEALGTEEAWFATIVTRTKQSLAQSFGKTNFVDLGEPINLSDSDHRVSGKITLSPVLIPASTFLENTANDYRAAVSQGDRLGVRVLSRSLAFLTDGLDSERLPGDVVDCMDEIQAAGGSK